MNYLWYLPRDLQRLIARYLVPSLESQVEEPQPAVSPSWLIYQELTGQTFPGLVVWDLGPSLLTQDLTQKEFQALDRFQSYHQPIYHCFSLILILGLSKTYLDRREKLDPEQIGCLNNFIKYNYEDLSPEIINYLVEQNQLELTEPVALAARSVVLLDRFFIRPQHWPTFKLFSHHLCRDSQTQDILAIYLKWCPRISLGQLGDAFHDFAQAGTPIDLSSLWAALDLSLETTQGRENHLINLLYDLVMANSSLAPEETGRLETLIQQTWTWLYPKTWEKVIRRCLYLLTEKIHRVDLYVVFFRLLFQFPTNSSFWTNFWFRLKRGTNFAEIKLALWPLLTQAHQAGRIDWLPE